MSTHALDPYEPPTPYSENGGASGTVGDPAFHTEELLDAAIRYVEGSKTMALSSSVMLNKDEMLRLLFAAKEQIPEEIRYAREMLRERSSFMAKVKREGEDIMDRAKDKAAQLIQKTEIMKEAERRARNIVAEAKEKSVAMRRDVDEYCDSRLGRFENFLRKTQEEVESGRKKFQTTDPLAEIAAQRHLQDQPAQPSNVHQLNPQQGQPQQLAQQPKESVSFFDQELN